MGTGFLNSTNMTCHMVEFMVFRFFFWKHAGKLNDTIESLRKQPTFRYATNGFPVTSENDVWKTSAEIPYWWRVTTQIWLVLLIGRTGWEFWFN